MSDKLRQLSHLRDDLLRALDQFPEPLRDINLFGNWSAKNIVAHLSGWDSYVVSCLLNLKEGKKSQNNTEIDEFNDKNVKDRADCGWPQTVLEYSAISKRLLDEYDSLTPEQFSQKFIKGANDTPADYLQIEIDHLEQHLDQIKEQL